MNYQVGTENRYLYNGKELHREEGLNWYEYGARMYDAAIGRFNTIDRFAEKYAMATPYHYTLNNPILFVDINGDSLFVAHKSGRKLLYHEGNYYENGRLLDTKRNGNLKGKGKGKGFFNKVNSALAEIRDTQRGKELVDGIASNETKHVTIEHANQRVNKPGSNGYTAEDWKTASDGTGSGGTVYWNPSTTQGALDIDGNTSRPSYIGLAHELAHGEDGLSGGIAKGYETIKLAGGRSIRIPIAEEYAVYVENQIRSQSRISKREYYGISINSDTGSLSGFYRMVDDFGIPRYLLKQHIKGSLDRANRTLKIAITGHD